MKEVDSIKRLFKPIQPSVKFDDDNVFYKEHAPSSQLENYISCYWQLRSKNNFNKPFVYRVVSDGCIDIFFEVENPSNSFIMGFCRRFMEFEIGKSFSYFGIRFLPSFFPLLFNVNAKTLSNKSQELKLVAPAFANWIANMDQDQSFIRLCNRRLEMILQASDGQIDERFYNAIQAILFKHGNMDIEKELSTGLSPRQLRRIFNFYLGTTPKAFANVVRFQHILAAKPSKHSLKENKLYYDVGFFDQAHFIKNFKTFYGVTPSVAFD